MRLIQTHNAPQAIGPYSQGVIMPQGARLVFVSGQVPIDPASGKMVDGDIRIQTQRVIDNLEAILRAGGCSLSKVVRVDMFLVDLAGDFAAVNEVYAERFTGPNFPARQTVQVAALPLGAPLEMSCLAYVEG